MFNSTSISESSPLNNKKLTPAPFRNISMITPTRPKRYNLADVSYTTSPAYRTVNGSRYSSSPSPSPKNESPQNEATRMIKTHIDSKSPGLTSRLVQYRKEKEQRSRPIIQAKYDKPGVFPIVHLAKKQLPVLKQSPVHSSLPSISEDYFRHNEHNKKLLETIVYPGSLSKNEEVNTRSVLDALKEISRKRLHGGEEYCVEEEDKRIRLDKNTPNNKKRYRDRSPLSEASISPKSPSVPFIDEVTASHSSMLGEPIQPKIIHSRKKKNTQTSPVTSKPKESVSVETQTVPEEVAPPPPKPVEVVKQKEEEPPKPVEKEVSTPKKAIPMKIFDERPLEIMRRNRLSLLMGLPLEKMESPSEILRKQFGEDLPEKPAEEKPLVSILSGANKSPIKKHVTFDVSEDTTSQASVVVSQSVSPSITQTSSSLVTPIVSAVVTNVVKEPEVKEVSAPIVAPVTSEVPKLPVSVPTFNFKSSEPPKTTPSLPIINFGETPKTVTVTTEEKKPTGGFKFDLGSSSSTAPKFEIKPISTATTTSSIGGFSFKPISTQVSSPVAISTPITSAGDKISFGGFKPSSVTSSTGGFGVTSPVISFGNAAPAVTKPPQFTFNSPTTSAVSFSAEKTAAPTFGKPTVPTFDTATTKPAVGIFGVSTTSSSSFVTSAVSTNASSGMFGVNTTTSSSFGATTSAPTGMFGVSTTSSSSSFVTSGATNNAPTGIFGVNTTSTSSFATNNTTTNAPIFGMITTSSSSFGTSTATTNAPSAIFGVATTSSATVTTKAPIFNINTTSSFQIPTTKPPTAIFGVATTSSAAPPVFGTGFGTTTTTTAAAPPAFGTNMFDMKPKPTFGIKETPKTTVSSMFPGATPSFNTAPASTPFGGGSTTTQGFNGFGATNNNNMFNSTPNSTPSTTSVFGVPATTAPAMPFGGGGGGGDAGKSMFGGNKFGTAAPTPATTAQFDSSNIFGTGNAFGTNSTGFGAPATTTTASTFSFGAASKPSDAFDSSSSFGKGFNNVQTGFGNTSTSGFGQFGATTTNNNTFGTNSAPAPTFPSSNFGSNTPAAPFGSSTFGSATNSTPAFGANANNSFGSGFGAPTTSSFANSTFGSAATPSFGATSTGFNRFASPTQPTSGFGSTDKPGEVFTFGGNKPAAPTGNSSGVFTFGSSEPPKPTFNFTAGGSGSFGATNTGFGAPAPAFGTPTASGFGAGPSAPGMFSIGSGSSTPTRASRTQIKAKRRT